MSAPALAEGLEALARAGACVEYRADFLAAPRAEALLARLLDEIDFDPPERSRIRRPFSSEWVEIPRRQAAYGDPGACYRFSGSSVEARPWIPPLAELREPILHACGLVSNFVLVNLYRDGRDCLGWHSDDEADLGPEPLIASLSLGATRDFQLRRRGGGRGAVTLPLASGSLLVMRHPTNRDFKHQLPRRGGRRAGEIGPRLNLTFRRVETLR